MKRAWVSMLAVLSGLGVTALSATSHAEVISVQFGINYGSGPLGSDEIAGLVPADNWTNVFPPNAATPAPVTVTNLEDSSDANTGASVTYFSHTLMQSSGTNTPNNKLFSGAMAQGYDGGDASTTPVSITLDAVPYATYDLIVYLQGRFAGSNGTAALDGVTTYTNLNLQADGAVAVTPTFVPITASSQAGGNYIRYTGLTNASSHTFTYLNNNASTSGISGIQIVEAAAVPEPATIGLVAALAPLALRRRRGETA